MWAAAIETKIPAWDIEMQRIKELNEDAWKDMLEVSARHWSISHFNTYTKFHLPVNNMPEAFNRSIFEHKEKPISTLL